MRTEIEEVMVSIEKETKDAWLLMSLDTGDKSWFPKSQVSWKTKTNGSGVAQIPVWLLENNGWE